MAAMTASHMAVVFGLLGNVVSFCVYLAPLPTFYRIWSKKSTEGFQSIPYSVALFSAMLTLYYGFLKTNGFMIITINSVGCAIETVYLIIYLMYASGRIRIYTIKLVVLFNVGAYGLILLSTSFIIPHRSQRVTAVGWICAVFSVGVFAAPLSIMRIVIKTRSVEYMPFALSFSLTLCAVMWFFYGLLVKDFFIASPNILGFIFGIAQMILYLVYKNAKNDDLPEFKLQELSANGVVQEKTTEEATTIAIVSVIIDETETTPKK
ncbi:bidirectional sugar transporter SWEET9-like [Humulus lupulus]|uniref:bidirectional sugar transporter SWEET9-like n=1 Tax=Humulus lupulus TaxID=3486 RepID=UPI002B400B06|nr:bidirectional sugar transporter SWEET9-like [Humulus lupulus]